MKSVIQKTIMIFLVLTMLISSAFAATQSFTSTGIDMSVPINSTSNIFALGMGLGTSSPSATLDIHASTPTLYLEDTDTGAYGGLFAGSSSGDVIVGADFGIASANSKLKFYVDNSEKVTILESGNTGIGTNNPIATLHSSGSGAVFQGNFGNYGALSSDALIVDVGTSVDIVAHDGSARKDMSLLFGDLLLETQSSKQFHFQEDGDFIVDDGSINAESVISVNGVNPRLDINSDAQTEVWYLQHLDANGDFRLFEQGSAAEVMRFQHSTGNVGIGTTSPSATLDVVGTTEIQGTDTTNTEYSVFNSVHDIDTGGNLNGAKKNIYAETTFTGRDMDKDLSVMEGRLILESVDSVDADADVVSVLKLNYTELAELRTSSGLKKALIYGGMHTITDGSLYPTYGLYLDGEDINYLSGNVGIGTTNPGAKMEIETDSADTSLLIDQNGNAIALNVDNAGTNRAINAFRTTANPTSNLVYFTEAASTSNQNVLEVKNEGTGYGHFIDQNGNGVGLNIDSEATSAAALQIATQTTSGAVNSAQIINSGIMSAGLGSVLAVVQEHASSSAQTLGVRNDGTGAALNIDQNGDGVALSIDSESTTARNIQVDSIVTGTNSLYIANSGIQTTGSGLVYLRQAQATTSESVLFIDQDGAAAAIEISGGSCISGQNGFYESAGDLYWCKNGAGTKLN